MSIQRYALVRGLGVKPDVVAAYLPKNYLVVWSGRTDWHYNTTYSRWSQVPGLVDDVVLIVGVDRAGFTLEKYIAPRLGSGMMRLDELDLSHPLMKEIPV